MMEARNTLCETRSSQQSEAAWSLLLRWVLVTALGGCVGYSSYPSGDYGYAYPNSYYAGHPRTYYSNSYSNRPYYSPYYSSYNNAYGGNN